MFEWNVFFSEDSSRLYTTGEILSHLCGNIAVAWGLGIISIKCMLFLLFTVIMYTEKKIISKQNIYVSKTKYTEHCTNPD